MLEKCLVYPEIYVEALRYLALVHREKGNFDKSTAMLRQVLLAAPQHEVAFDLASLFALTQDYEQAIIFFTQAIELGVDNIISLEPTKLAEYYMHRAQVYTAVGLHEHASRDMENIKQADPHFVSRYGAQAQQLDELGQHDEAERIRYFI